MIEHIHSIFFSDYHGRLMVSCNTIKSDGTGCCGNYKEVYTGPYFQEKIEE